MKFPNWHLYRISPIDDWGGWTPAVQALSEGAEYDPEKIPSDIYAAVLEQSREAAKLLGWKGDGDRVYVAGFPNGDGNPACFMLAWKQERGGTTFLWSPYPLPHLEERIPNWVNARYP